MPVLRKSDIKFKKPAQSTIQAKAPIPAEAKKIFEDQFEKKERASIAVPVEIMDQNGMITMTGTYEWFVQKL